MFNWNWSLSLPILSNLFGHHGGAPTPTSHVTPSDSRAVTFTSGVKTSSVKVILADDRALMPVNVNGEKFELIVDTGSTISWLYTQRTPKYARGNAPYYNLKSKDLVPDGSYFQLYGGLNWVGGDVFQADFKMGNMTIENQALGSGDIMNWESKRGSGLLGLAFPYWNTAIGSNNASVLERITPNLAQPLYTTSLKSPSSAYIDFGTIDPKKYSGNITYITADSSTGWWGVPLTSSIGNSTPAPGSAILDTGSVTVMLNAGVVDAFYDKVFTYGVDQETGFKRVRCTDRLPDITLSIDGYSMTIGGETLMSRQGKDKCLCLLQAETIPGMSILGLPFYRSRFVVHKPNYGGQPQLGFAKFA